MMPEEHSVVSIVHDNDMAASCGEMLSEQVRVIESIGLQKRSLNYFRLII